MNINVVVIGGNVVKDPEYKIVGESCVASFSVAINRRSKDRAGNIKEDVDFIAVTAWGRNAEISRDYVRKGNPVVIEGQIRQERWTSDEGKQQSKTKVLAQRIQLVSRKPAEGGSDEESH